MRAWEFYHHIINECKKHGKLAENAKMIEDLPKVLVRRAMYEEYDDPELNEFINDYGFDYIKPKNGDWFVELTSSNLTPEKPVLEIHKSQVLSDKQPGGLTNDDILKYNNIGTMYFRIEQDVDIFIMSLKLKFQGYYEVVIT